MALGPTQDRDHRRQYQQPRGKGDHDGYHLQIDESGGYKYDHRKLFYRGEADVVVGDQIAILDTTYTVVAVLPYKVHKEIVLNACQ